MVRIIQAIEQISERTGQFVSWLTTALVLIVCFDVFTRYFLRKSSIAIQELEWHLFGVIFLVGAAYTLKHGRHVRVDVLYVNFSARKRALVDLIGAVVFLLPFAALIIWNSLGFVHNAFLIGETSPDPGGLPARFLLKACIPLGFFLLMLQGVAMALRAVRVLTGAEEPS